MKEILLTKLANALDQTYPKLTPRKVKIPFIKDKVHAVIGMRRSGKTYFLYQCLQERLEAGQDRETLLYINFEDERLADLKAEQLGLLIEEYYRMYPAFRKKHRVTFCFDEIQVVSGWEQCVRRLLDEEKVEIFISGSSAKMLSREVATSMRGRALEAWITPFSFYEFLIHQKIPVPEKRGLFSDAKQSEMLHAFDQYLAIGGFPEAQNLYLKERIQLLQGYVDAVLLRDLIERYHLTNITALRSLVRQLLGNASAPFSISKIYNDFRSQGISVSKESLLNYFHYLEDSFLIAPLEIYTQSARRRQVNPRKVYLADHSLATAFAVTKRENTGHCLENIIACELLRTHATVHYYKTRSGYEIDFLATDYSGKQVLTQVASSLADSKTLERETRALWEASEALPDASLQLITISEARTIRLDKKKSIAVFPAWYWLLMNKEDGV